MGVPLLCMQFNGYLLLVSELWQNIDHLLIKLMYWIIKKGIWKCLDVVYLLMQLFLLCTLHVTVTCNFLCVQFPIKYESILIFLLFHLFVQVLCISEKMHGERGTRKHLFCYMYEQLLT